MMPWRQRRWLTKPRVGIAVVWMDSKSKMRYKITERVDEMRRCLVEKDTSSFNAGKEDLVSHEEDAVDCSV